MKNIKRLLTSLLIFILTGSVFLGLAPRGYAQTDTDWSVPVNLSLSGAASDPAMVVDSRGFIHVIWVDEVDGYKYSESRDDGKTWSMAQTVRFPFVPKDSPPVLIPGANGYIHIFWLTSDNRLMYAQATSGDLPYPSNWILRYRLSNSVAVYDVIVDDQGVLHVAFIQKQLSEGRPAGVYYTQSPSAGGYWTESRLLYQSEYFRSTNADDLYVRISTSNTIPGQKIFITWDNRAQKRVYMAVSEDTGITWNDVQQVKGPADTGGIDTPFNLTVAASNNNVLLIWQVGEPGSSKCTIYSQWSTNGGETWGETIAVLGGRSECPLSMKFVVRDANYMIAVLIGQVSPIMVAWNGEQWSDAQSQTQLPSFSNPLTFDAVLLGCRFDLFQEDHLYVAGCDQGGGGDIWFLSRPIEPVDRWFSPSSIWGDPEILSIKSEKPQHISYLSASADNLGNVHVLWAQSPAQNATTSDATIEYARWNDEGWSNPETVQFSLAGVPLQLSVEADSKGRLLLSWVDDKNGDLLYSWANLERANIESEWEEFVGLPIPSNLINSPDIVVDGSGRMVVAYVIPVNEDRGVYVVQSSDNGSSWSIPVKVFDAVASNWEELSQPKISLGSDGVLHLIFIRSTLRTGQPVGLYYSRSEDGGATWSDAQVLSEREIHWADIASYGDDIVHAVWQEYDGLVFANVSQVSQDGGVTWGKYNDITGVNNTSTLTALASDKHGLLHFITLIKSDDAKTINQENLTLQDWKWNNSNWEPELTKDIVINGEDVSYSLSADMTASGYLIVLIPIERVDPTVGTTNEVWIFSRFLEDSKRGQLLQVPIIPSPLSESNESNIVASEIAPTPDFSILYDDNVSSSPFQRNIAGVILIAAGVVATIFLLVWRRPSKRQ